MKNKVNAKKGQQPRKRNETSGKEKNWTLFVTDQASDNTVCYSTDNGCASNDKTGGFKYIDRTIEWMLDSGCGRHLTGNARLLSSNVSNASTSLYLPDGLLFDPPNKARSASSQRQPV